MFVDALVREFGGFSRVLRYGSGECSYGCFMRDFKGFLRAFALRVHAYFKRTHFTGVVRFLTGVRGVGVSLRHAVT